MTDQLEKRFLPTTQRECDRLELRDGKDEYVWSRELRGFALRLRANGSRTWVLNYVVSGKERRMTLGEYAMLPLKEAFEKARRLKNGASDGVDPLSQKEDRRVAAASTVGSYVDEYLAYRAVDPLHPLKPRRLQNVTRCLQVVCAPLHNVPVDQLTPPMVEDLLDEVTVESGPYAADDARKALGTYYVWLIRRALCRMGNPVTREGLHQKRARFLREAEVHTLWHDAGSDDYGCALKLLLLTGMRRGEVENLRWSDVVRLGTETARIELAGDRVKNEEAYLVPLSRQAQEVLLELRARSTGDRVFRTVRWHAEKARISLEDWRVHDLRRTFATLNSEHGWADEVIEAALNHVKPGVKGVYNRAAHLPERQKMLTEWGDFVARLVNPNKVVSLVA